jgi:hypothetical protein
VPNSSISGQLKASFTGDIMKNEAKWKRAVYAYRFVYSIHIAAKLCLRLEHWTLVSDISAHSCQLSSKRKEFLEQDKSLIETALCALCACMDVFVSNIIDMFMVYGVYK